MRRNNNTSSVRIIAGALRGRKIFFTSVDGLRPTLDRIRETVFNWLMPYISDARCLDLFAGTGAMGMEALSRGAKEVVFIEKNKTLCQDLNHNFNALGVRVGTVINAALNMDLKIKHQPFDIIFLDPPFNTELLETSLLWLHKNKLLHDESLVYIETALRHDFLFPDYLSMVKQKKTKSICYSLYEVCF